VTRFTEGYAAPVAPLPRALRAFDEPDGGGEVFPKLGISSRRELRRALPGAEDAAVPA